MRLRERSVALLLCLACSTAFATPFGGSLRINSVDLGFVNAGDPSILLITGKNLGRFRGALNCDIETTAGSDSGTTCFVTYIEASKQLEVHLQAIKATKSSDYLLRFCDVSKDKRTFDQGCTGEPIKVATLIHVVKATNSTAPPANPGASPSPANPSPFSDCLNANSNPSAVLTSRGSANSTSVNCAASLLTESEVTDNFGRHVDKTYFAIQVRVSNQNSNYDFLLRDILLTLPDGRVISSRIRRFAQGVAVKGKSLDRRAVFYNSLQAAGSLYGGLAIFASTGFQAAGNALQGPLMQGFAQIFPDTTTDNVNRFNTAVFDDQSPSIVPKDSIGQPPLYVVALVPKTGNAETDKRYGNRIAVSLEGTFIKQVSLVSITPNSVKYDPEYISPPTTTANDPAVLALRNASVSKRVQISNNNSTVMNISGISLLSANGKSSQDFEIDPQKTTCGAVAGGSSSWDPKAKFTIAAQSFCDVWIRTTPQAPGTVSATLVVEGDNLDGSKTVYLEGQGVGFIYDLTNGSLPKVPAFGCSYSNSSCQAVPLGTIGAASWTFPVYYYLPTGASSLGLSWQQKGKAAVTSCNGVTSAPDWAAGKCTVTLDLSDASGNAGLTLTGNGWSSTVNFTYQTTSATLVMTAPSPGASITVGMPIALNVTVQDSAHNTLAVPDGTQIQFTISGCQSSATSPIAVGTKGGVATLVSFTTIAPGVCKVDATMPATGIYSAASLSTGSLTAALPASSIASTAATSGVDSTKSFAIPITVTANPAIAGVTCTGPVSYVSSPAGLVLDSGGTLTLSSGAVKLTVTSGMASGKSYTVAFKYAGDGKACAAAPDFTFSFATQ